MHVSIRPAVFMAEFYARLHMAKEEEEERSLLQSWLFLLAGDELYSFTNRRGREGRDSWLAIDPCIAIFI